MINLNDGRMHTYESVEEESLKVMDSLLSLRKLSLQLKDDKSIPVAVKSRVADAFSKNWTYLYYLMNNMANLEDRTDYLRKQLEEKKVDETFYVS